MGGPGSGGVRAGKRGVAYGNREDLNALPIRTATGQTYGAAGAQAASQRVIPMGGGGSMGSSPSGVPSPHAPSGQSTPFSAPTTRPNEPVTAGMPTGPGAGPDAVMMPQFDNVDLQLRALYRLYPNNDLLDLIENIDRGAASF